MRFLADENVSRLVTELLRLSGFDVTSIGETKSGASDKDVLEAAAAGDCILITEDRDFGELVIRQQLGVRGMILLELDRLSNVAEADAVAEVSAMPTSSWATSLASSPDGSASGLCSGNQVEEDAIPHVAK